MLQLLDPVRTAAPASQLLTLAQAKAQCRLAADDTSEDDLLTRLIATATAQLDGWTGILARALVTQSWAESYPLFTHRMPLRLGPVQSVTSVTYLDADGATQGVASTVWSLYTANDQSWLQEREGQAWPGGTATRPDAVTITYVAGHGAAADVPAPIVHACAMLVGHYFEHREAVLVGTIGSEMPLSVRALVLPFRRRVAR